jgi:DNA-binding MarR family transcriptional regulator
MTQSSPLVDFMVRLKKIDHGGHTCRDIFVLWAVKQEPGLMGRELAMKLGYKTRSAVQNRIGHLIRAGLLEDRRARISQLTPNDLYITPAGERFLAEVVPA